MIPFVKFAGVFSYTNIATEWVQSDEGQSGGWLSWPTTYINGITDLF
jgi:hypothetical protein